MSPSPPKRIRLYTAERKQPLIINTLAKSIGLGAWQISSMSVTLHARSQEGIAK